MDDRRRFAKETAGCQVTPILEALDPPDWVAYRDGHHGPVRLETHHVFGRGFDGCHQRWNLCRALTPAHRYVGAKPFGRLICVWSNFERGVFGPKEAEAARIGDGKDFYGFLSGEYAKPEFHGGRKGVRRLAWVALLYAGRICPYCEGASEVAPYEEFDDRFPGRFVWVCRRCDARVGCHRKTQQALGILADAETRKARRDAHAAFDPLWQGDDAKRSDRYRWLSGAMGLPLGLTHIGMFDADQCRKVIELCGSVSPVHSGPSFIGAEVDC